MIDRNTRGSLQGDVEFLKGMLPKLESYQLELLGFILDWIDELEGLIEELEVDK